MKTLFSLVSFGVWAMSNGLAQSPASQPRFEVASVKPAAPGAKSFSMDGGPLPPGPFNQVTHDPGRITWTNVWLKRVLQVAYDFPADRISGPDWLETERYNIVAAIPRGTTIDDFKRMVRDLLAERFQLALHRETKEHSGYVLEIARNGPRFGESLKESRNGALPPASPPRGGGSGGNALMMVDPSGFPAPRPGSPVFPPGAPFSGTIAANGRYRATVLNERMAKIAEFLGNAAGMPVQDQTGLTGTYDVHLEYMPNPAPTASPGGAPADSADPGPDLFAAVQTQLGLKLTPKKVPVEMLVIDRAERVPTEN